MASEEEYMTFDEKVALSKVVEKLPGKEHPNIYRIVLESDPNALEECDDPNWVLVDFAVLKPSTLKELEGYIASREVNTQSEIEENNPVLQNEENTAESTAEKKESPRKKESDIEENNPVLQNEENTAESTAEKKESPRKKAKKGSDENAKKESIKARLRTPKVSRTGSSKRD